MRSDLLRYLVLRAACDLRCSETTRQVLRDIAIHEDYRTAKKIAYRVSQQNLSTNQFLKTLMME